MIVQNGASQTHHQTEKELIRDTSACLEGLIDVQKWRERGRTQEVVEETRIVRGQGRLLLCMKIIQRIKLGKFNLGKIEDITTL